MSIMDVRVSQIIKAARAIGPGGTLRISSDDMRALANYLRMLGSPDAPQHNLEADSWSEVKLLGVRLEVRL